jgi:limonene-1,2-epoxide hydrolase
MTELQGASPIQHASSRTPNEAGGPVDVVQSFLAALERFDVEAAVALLAEDVVYQNYPLPPQRGKRSVARALRLLPKITRRFEARMHHIGLEPGGSGVVLTERTDVLVGPLLDLQFWVCGTFEVRDGKIVLWRDRFDVGLVVAQMLTSPARRLLRRS